MRTAFRMTLLLAAVCLLATGARGQAPHPVSLCQIMAKPQTYEGRLVAISGDVRADLALTARCPGAGEAALPILFTVQGRAMPQVGMPRNADIYRDPSFHTLLNMLVADVPHAPAPASLGVCRRCYRKYCEVKATFIGYIAVTSAQAARRNQGFGFMRRSPVAIDLKDVKGMRGRPCRPNERHLPPGWPAPGRK